MFHHPRQTRRQHLVNFWFAAKSIIESALLSFVFILFRSSQDVSSFLKDFSFYFISLFVSFYFIFLKFSFLCPSFTDPPDLHLLNLIHFVEFLLPELVLRYPRFSFIRLLSHASEIILTFPKNVISVLEPTNNLLSRKRETFFLLKQRTSNFRYFSLPCGCFSFCFSLKQQTEFHANVRKFEENGKDLPPESRPVPKKKVMM